MPAPVDYFTPDGVMKPIGPYSHIAKAGDLIMISATAGVDPDTGDLIGPDIGAQTIQIIDSFENMLKCVGADLAHILHITVFLKDMADFADMNAAYKIRLGDLRPARSAVSVLDLPKPGARVTMNLTAVAPVNGLEISRRTDQE